MPLTTVAELERLSKKEPWTGIKVYLAGPMRGKPEFNFPAFHAAAADLRRMGFEVWSPAENDEKKHGKDFSKKNAKGDEVAAAQAGFSLREALGADLDWICEQADGIVLLPGWQDSKGAKAEKATAEALSLSVLYYHGLNDLRAEPIAAPASAAVFPTDAKERKTFPVYSGVLKYFPDAIAAVAHVSWVGNNQHNPGQPLHWARGKSTDQEDTLLRHVMEAGTIDVDGVRHSAKTAWRALAILQLEIEKERGINRG